MWIFPRPAQNGWQETQSYINDYTNIETDDHQLLGRSEAGGLAGKAKAGIVDQNLWLGASGIERRGVLDYRALFDQIEHQHQGPRPAGRRDFIDKRFELGAAARNKREIVADPGRRRGQDRRR